MKKKINLLSLFFIRHKEYLPTVVALTLWALFGVCHWLFGWTIIPFGYVTSFLFGLIGVQLFAGAILWWMSVALPHLRKRLDHDNENIDEEKLTEWQITVKALVLFGLLLLASVWLANKF
jgi:hypothetical protein